MKQNAARRRRIRETLTKHPGSTMAQVWWRWDQDMTRQECSVEMQAMLNAGELRVNGQGRFYIVEGVNEESN